jgi:hypothetical protein
MKIILEPLFISLLMVFPLLPIILSEYNIYKQNNKLKIIQEQHIKDLDNMTLNIMKKYNTK